ncbi:beta-galactosidase [Enterococcus nangangensis]|uniref:beta-galactosidase n=1 Tax=Enterococcus nangangensis TaxID=2559926 RepID=UPI0010F556EA|nr:beta-galactosidase [Enterococcus nangangensis]
MSTPKKLYYGSCLYPELWDEATVRADLQRMKSLGMNEVRFGEFIWSKLEPQENQFQMDYLEKYLTLFAEFEMHVILCIPTPTPPRWLTYQHPERLAQTLEGTTFQHGARQHVCTNNEYFQKRALLLTEKIAAVAKNYPNIIAIQIDNEFKAHTDLCGCERCQKQWHHWLKEHYQTIEKLNTAWGTAIWSEEYQDFAEVPQPQPTPFLHNASLMNAYRQFTEDGITKFCGALAAALRQETSIPLTHNSGMGFNLNNAALFNELDIAGFDTYAAAANYPGFTINLDLFRNLKPNHRFMLLETSTSHAGHLASYGSPHPKGYLPAEAFVTFASGSELFNYWHFRGHPQGVEQPHSTVISSWGEPTYAYDDIVEVGKLFTAIQAWGENSVVVPPKVALLYADRGRRFMNTETGGKGQPSYRGRLTEFYRSLLASGLMVDCLPEEADFAPYQVLFVPYLHYVSKALLAKIKTFVAQGGTCVVGPMTGDRTKEHAWPTDNGLGALGEYLDLKDIVEENLAADSVTGKAFGTSFPLAGYSLLFTTQHSLGEASGEFASGRSFISEKQVGAGRCLYLGALPQDYATTNFWSNFLQEVVTPDLVALKVSAGVVYYQRQTTNGQTQYWLTNLTNTPQSYEASQLTLTFSNQKAAVLQKLQPYECQILSATP